MKEGTQPLLEKGIYLCMGEEELASV